MPSFQHHLDRGTERRESANVHVEMSARTPPRRLSEESIRTEFCEGPLPDTPPDRATSDHSNTCTDRADLIERIKRGESPTWIPHRHQFHSAWNQQNSEPRSPSPKRSPTSPELLPAPTITPEKTTDDERRWQHGMEIDRPRSALHSGDFTQDKSQVDEGPSQAQIRPDFSGNGLPWLATSPPRDFAPLQFERRTPLAIRTEDSVRSALSSLSSSISANFAYKPPTSPLFQSESYDDYMELPSPMRGIEIGSSLPRQSRRHTLNSSRPGSYGYSPNPVHRHPPSFRQERTFPYQAHQPRRSLTSAPIFSKSSFSPQSPALSRPRRPSIGSDQSPLHASMVGSYEESILRGRMSTTPSKPLDFLAEIGVLGKDKCKASLRCPPHVTLPFPAVFYSYASSSHGRIKDDDGPSPYVGLIDLENGLPNQEENIRSKRKAQVRDVARRATAGNAMDADDEMVGMTSHNQLLSDWSQETKQRSGSPKATSVRNYRVSEAKRGPSSLKAPLGGSYRIPEKGHIQIIIKNPNKTAVKLFLIPYDLTGMEPGTKTFVRQRCYSDGPIINNLPDLTKDSASNRPVLRYLVHLHICCPSRGRFYLYKSIRVVFANRVPDGKERLQNEITLPEPRFTSYKPIRVMHPPISSGTGPGASLVADTAFRRRSSGFYFNGSSRVFDVDEDLAQPPSLPHHQPFSFSFGSSQAPVEPIPFRLPDSGKKTMRIKDETNLPLFPLQSPDDSSQTSRPTTQNSSNLSDWDGYDGQIDRYNKLSKGDVGYGGNTVAESLLSQRLKSLGVQAWARGEYEEPLRLSDESASLERMI
ncbi:hypothetical protein F5Y16DRAFT_388754 [Xylariaceae sp. FL0255]|nr:hypothetical protein F5Y16DRAFT_388754 [Xylariaceae sp. FL0255]